MTEGKDGGMNRHKRVTSTVTSIYYFLETTVTLNVPKSMVFYLIYSK